MSENEYEAGRRAGLERAAKIAREYAEQAAFAAGEALERGHVEAFAVYISSRNTLVHVAAQFESETKQ